MFGELFAGLLVTAFFAGMAYALGMISTSGAVGGFVVGVLVYASLGWRGFAVLALFVVGGSALTRVGYRVKQIRGTAEGRGGRRGARNAFANSVVAVVCAGLAAATSRQELFAAAFVASLGAAFADTAASEVGPLFSATPRRITTLERVPAGTDGAVSLPGTLAGAGAALLTAAFGLSLGLLGSPSEAAGVALASFAGMLADSLVGATLPGLGNELTNVACTLVGALVGLSLVAAG
ncbi:DUF92 domain-containing protein [Rubrobacter calidifluminis]|uniref:DUF92 domain-containing protein n=1 Tax=Rubrobacter calidifluminis TaxID=1392640 RepID=UPI002361E781|nr:DUF92 domain-containing protein [Rubrobacter calidifluminis]